MQQGQFRTCNQEFNPARCATCPSVRHCARTCTSDDEEQECSFECVIRVAAVFVTCLLRVDLFLLSLGMA